MDVICVSGVVRGCFIVCAVVVERGLPLLLPHPGRGPAQSAERVWPKRGSETEGRSFVGFEKGEERVVRSERMKENCKREKRVQFGRSTKLQSVERVLVFRSERNERETKERKSAVCEEQSGSRGVLRVASK